MSGSKSEPRTDKQRISWLRWSVARGIANSRLPQASAFIPAIGYALLWSDDFSRWMGSRELLGEGLLTVGFKLRLLWWGAIAMTLGWALYRWRCPSIIRRSAEPNDYVIEQLQLRNLNELREVGEIIKMHAEDYDLHDKRKLLLGDLAPESVRRASQALLRDNVEGLFGPNHTHHIVTGLTLYYHIVDHSYPWSCRLALALLGGGAFAFLIPSGEVMLRVIASSFR